MIRPSLTPHFSVGQSQAELTDAKELLLHYENALKLGVGKNDLQDPVIRDLNKENWKTPGARYCALIP